MTRLKNHQRSETYTSPATLPTEGGIGNKRASYVAPAGQGVPPIPSADDGTSVFRNDICFLVENLISDIKNTQKNACSLYCVK